MARTVKVFVVDDIDGSEQAETVEFAFDGSSYSIDLSSANKERLAAALEPFIAKATRVGRGARSSAPTGRARRNNAAPIREWARENGYKVSERGRVPAPIVEAYEAANK